MEMNEVLQFLTDNPTFYLATTDGAIPRVRPFGVALKFDGRLCFCTNNQKNVYQQLKANPHFEVAVTAKNGEWLRLQGKAVFNTSRESKQAALAAAPVLSNIYTVDDPAFETFYIDQAEATFSNLQGSSRTVKF